MWNEPYLETCCRSALHRLLLCGGPGRPAGLKDGPCLERMAGMGLAAERDGRYHLTDAGHERHDTEALVQPRPAPAGSKAARAAASPAAQGPAR